MLEKLKASYWVRSGFFSFGQRFSDLFLGVGSFYFLVRVLTKEQFGAWSLFITASTVIELGKNGLIKNGLIKFTNSHDETDYRDIQGASLMLNLFASLGISAVVVLMARPLSLLWDSREIEILFYLLPLNILCLVPYSHISFAQQAKMRFASLFWSTFIRRSFFLAFVLIVFIFNIHITLNTLLFVQCLSLLVSSAISYFLIRDILVFGFNNFKAWLGKLFNYGKYVFGTNLSGYLASSVDQFMIGAMLNTSAVASYNIAVRVTSLIEVPTNSISTIVFPKSSQLSVDTDKDKLRSIYETSTGLILALLLPAIAFVLIFPSFVIWVLAGDAYADATRLLQITILFALFVPFLRQSGTILDSIGRPKINFYFTLLNLTIIPVLNFFFIRWWNLEGAAFASLLTYFILFVLNQILLNNILGVRITNILGNTALFYQKAFTVIGSYGRKALFRG